MEWAACTSLRPSATDWIALPWTIGDDIRDTDKCTTLADFRSSDIANVSDNHGTRFFDQRIAMCRTILLLLHNFFQNKRTLWLVQSWHDFKKRSERRLQPFFCWLLWPGNSGGRVWHLNPIAILAASDSVIRSFAAFSERRRPVVNTRPFDRSAKLFKKWRNVRHPRFGVTRDATPDQSVEKLSRLVDNA